ncbi:NAD(P)-dependent oxidoreductase [Crossiella sp. CA-258035]|uniref:NAD(P)-dependent oxidoreductase n=1 Tax=Crossiella sp. CA-258035 TaxID=2981138 RepID=UPI0024BC007D|nr:NAD(P)-dependent oxidoreductase [Crossiella sp. CA-258035]WHT17836.1 NAD(P)-dependent oxidoreductase [Crossiella sp. CA-258035]
MARIAFLGLGRMGVLMAGRLLTAGHDLTVWNRTAAKAEPLAWQGARVAADPAGAVDGAQFVITMLADGDAVDEVIFGTGAGAAKLAAGATVVEMSTSGPEAVRNLRAKMPEGTTLVDAPVKGTLPQAEGGTLDIYVGGTEAEFAAVREVLSVLGNPVRVGETGAGASLKLVVNAITATVPVLIGEAMALADGMGVDAGTAWDALAGSAVGGMARRMREQTADDGQPITFSLSLAAKDLRLALEAGAAAEGVIAAARRELGAAEQAGLGERDFSAVVTHLRQRD